MPMHNPAHPGEVLKDVLEAIPMSQAEFATHIGISRTNFSRILNGRAGVTPEMSIRLAQAFGQPDMDIWFKMQAAYDFSRVARKKRKVVRPVLGKVAA